MSATRRPLRPGLTLFTLLVMPLALLPLQSTAAHAGEGEICRLAVTVTTGHDGIRDDSSEFIQLAGQQLLFEDHDGDGVTDAEPLLPFHRGGTGDERYATYTWNVVARPCIPQERVVEGFTFIHDNQADDWMADNWNLAGLRIEERDTHVVLYDHSVPDPDGNGGMHRFLKNAQQTWNTLDGDVDDDGIPDRVERSGIPHARGVDDWLPANGADPCRKTIAVEVDWLRDATFSHQPDAAMVTEARDMFARAPVPSVPVCPYTTARSPSGVQLLVHVDDGITTDTRTEPLNVGGADGVTPFDGYRADHFAPERRGVFHYNLWGARQNKGFSGGVCCVGPRREDFIISLGSETRRVRLQSAAFVHELGHALGLHHGGTDRVNYKPHYLSVMNYRYGDVGIPDFGEWQARMARLGPATTPWQLSQTLDEVSRLDYSGRRLPTLFRDALSERDGVGSPTDDMVAWWDNDSVLRVGDASGPLNWNFNRVIDSGRVAVDINGEEHLCIVGRDSRPDVTDSQRLLETSVATGDVRHGEAIYAGLDADCDSQAVTTDTASVPHGTDFGALSRYADGLAGADDWSNVKIHISGPDGGSGPAVPGDEISEPSPEEAEAARAELLDAMVAAAGPAPSAPRWGYAYMNRATETEAPIGVPTVLNNAFQWSTAADAGWAGTVTHLATGEYEVRLPGIGGSGGVAHVTPYRTDNSGRSCAVRGYRPDGADELIRVGCVDRTGAPVDWWFTVFYAAPATGADSYATLRYDVPGGGVSVPAVANDGTYNSAGRVNRVVRDGVGRYRAVLTGASFAANDGHLQINQFGTDAPARCNPYARTAVGDTLEVSIACFTVSTSATAQPVDTLWILSYAARAGLHGVSAVPAAYAQVTGDPANPVVDEPRSWASTGQTPALVRLGIGNYRLTWDTVGKYGGSVQLVATGADGSTCHLGNIGDYAAPPRVSVDVWCYGPTGLRADAPFAAAYVRRP
ncbi:hypothetical protein ABZY06_35095 [Streptomyces sp. NPDC006540]|uniref:hypothetical protein n=1 Tax=Streptomyces sp. NPDC006540 TaxID=3155353 RepID=UPI0033A5EFAC